MKHLRLQLMFVLLAASGFSQWNNNTAINQEIAGLNAGTIQTATTSEGKNVHCILLFGRWQLRYAGAAIG